MPTFAITILHHHHLSSCPPSPSPSFIMLTFTITAPILPAGRVMLDPFPFGGGVTALEAFAVCTPVVTMPGAQTVPELAAGV
jgi:hypothetical protein